MSALAAILAGVAARVGAPIVKELLERHVGGTGAAIGGVSLASYVASSNPAWAAEAQAFVAWRDAAWAHAYAELDKVLTGQREQPSVEAFLGELPVIEWPA